jgi:photosystem II stability/assembly factor-like uncharacterized protein
MVARHLTVLMAVCLVAASTSALARPKPGAPATAAQRDAAWARHQQLERDSEFAGLKWRAIGPMVQGGRVVDIENIPGNPYGFYVAYATGGVWKTIDNGVNFEPLSDHLATIVAGDIAVDANNPQRLWVGSGEPNSSRSSYGGLGVFRSDDGGRTFANVGLADSDRIGGIWVDPSDGDHVCVAALGKLYSTGGQRGVFCTRDAGGAWTQTLDPDGEWTGAIDIAADPSGAKVLYAATWERSRTPWNFVEGGPGSGVYKSGDGGDSWARVEGGFPRGKQVGRIGLAVSRSQPSTLYATVDSWTQLAAEQQDLGDRPLSAKRLKTMSKAEFLRQDPDEIEAFIRDNDLDTSLDAKALLEKVRKDEVKMADLVAALSDANAALFDADIHGLEVWRSDDAGATWRRTHDEPIREVTYTYGYYFGPIRVAPDNPEKVYAIGVPMIASEDGGKTWKTLQDPDVHVDYHAWWIDPANPQRMLVGNDGGVDLSYDGGKTWIKLDRQPVGQFYTVMVDMAEPYNVYGGLQDNGTLKGSSKTRPELGQDWSQIGGGDGMHVAVDTRDNTTVYTGYQFGYYQRAGAGGTREVRPREKLGEAALRYNWNTPVMVSPHNADVVYYAANMLFRSFDQGESWSAISADLTSSKLRGDVPFATITSVSESPLAFGLVWAGTDDGNLWVTTGGGDKWARADDKLPADRWVSRVMASAKVRERAYVSLNGYRQDDATPYVYVTEDLGKSWRSIAGGLPAEAVNVVREDPENADVLYVGTDRGVYVSLDRGGSWQALQGGLPNVPVHDLIVHPRERELVAGTHGRSVWIVDVLPVQELSADVRGKAVHVFALSPVQADRGWRGRAARWFDETPYLPKVCIPFWAGSAGTATVELLDADKRPLRRFEVAAVRGMNTVDFDLQLDRDLALAAERAAADNAKAEEKPTAEDEAAAKGDEGALAKTPYAESVRLGHRLFPVKGKYRVQVAMGAATSDTELEIKAPEDFKPRGKAAPKIRGKDGYAGSAARATPSPVSARKTKPL